MNKKIKTTLALPSSLLELRRTRWAYGPKALLTLVLILTVFFANFAYSAETDKKYESDFAYGRVSYVDTELPLNFNPNSFREKCMKYIKFLQKANFKDHFRAMDYYYFVPDKKNIKKGGKVPLVVFLHGMAEGGTDVKVLFRHPQPLIFIDPENQKKFPCYFVAPQQYDEGVWMGYSNLDPKGNSDAMLGVLYIIKTMKKHFPNIDEDRIYLTGLSSGGHGSCEALMKNPGVFAGIVPIAGGWTRKEFTDVRQKVGIWAFWNDNEWSGTRKETMNTLKKFAKRGADARYTKFHPNHKPRFSRHLSWAWAYAEPDLIPWLFSHTRNKDAK